MNPFLTQFAIAVADARCERALTYKSGIMHDAGQVIGDVVIDGVGSVVLSPVAAQVLPPDLYMIRPVDPLLLVPKP